jgi:hypothetical protein
MDYVCLILKERIMKIFKMATTYQLNQHNISIHRIKTVHCKKRLVIPLGPATKAHFYTTKAKDYNQK